MSVRRTWDKDYYGEKAKERLERGDDYDVEESKKVRVLVKEEFAKADEGIAGPSGSHRAFLKARDGKIDLESKIGKTEIIKPNTAEMARGGAGFYCEVCKCLLKDSVSYLDHVNGKKHQKALNFSMRVERVGVDAVRNRLEIIKRKIDESKTNIKVSPEDEYNSRIAIQITQDENRKKKKKEEIIAKKIEAEQAELETMDPEIAAMMGFGGFGKKR